jgi:hypothetical protein
MCQLGSLTRVSTPLANIFDWILSGSDCLFSTENISRMWSKDLWDQNAYKNRSELSPLLKYKRRLESLSGADSNIQESIAAQLLDEALSLLITILGGRVVDYWGALPGVRIMALYEKCLCRTPKSESLDFATPEILPSVELEVDQICVWFSKAYSENESANQIKSASFQCSFYAEDASPAIENYLRSVECTPLDELRRGLEE